MAGTIDVVVDMLDADVAARRRSLPQLRLRLRRRRGVLPSEAQAEIAGADPGARDAGHEAARPPTACETAALTFLALVDEAYAKEFAGTPLVLTDKNPRVATRVALAFEQRGLAFQEARVASLFLRKLSTDPSKVLDASAMARFERLFAKLNAVVARMRSEGRAPFR